MRKYLTIRSGKKGISYLIDRKAIKITLFLLCLLIVALLICAGLGETNIGPWQVLQTIVGQGNASDQLIVMTFRMPRILVAIFVGMALATAGAILQGVIRNPLASPDIIGITGGAGAAVVLFLALFSNSSGALMVSINWLPLSAFIGATVTAILVYLLSWKKGGVASGHLVLVGIGISALAKAITTFVTLMGPIYLASQANIWLTGSVYGSNWQDVSILVPWTIALMTISFILARTINVQELGDTLAVGLGSAVQKKRFFLILLSTGLVGGAVAFGGAVSFVGLISPHIARRLVGSSFGVLLPASAIIGALLVLIADTIGRTVFSPIEVPAGVFTAAVGAPYFIFLVLKSRKV